MGAITGADLEHPASGNVSLEGRTLSFEGINISEGPDAHVYLSEGRDKESGKHIAKMTSFTEDHCYEVPEDIDPTQYDSVVVWWEEFSVPMALADV